MATFFAIGIILNLIIGAALLAWVIKQRKLRAAQTTPAAPTQTTPASRDDTQAGGQAPPGGTEP